MPDSIPYLKAYISIHVLLLVLWSQRNLQGQNQALYPRLPLFPCLMDPYHQNNFDLYGFFDLQEKRFYELLIGVSGVGPKAAISLLSTLNTDTLIMAVLNEDLKTITSAPGIGKKIAQRIILELREKMSGELPSFSAASVETLVLADESLFDAKDALTLLQTHAAESGASSCSCIPNR